MDFVSPHIYNEYVLSLKRKEFPESISTIAVIYYIYLLDLPCFLYLVSFTHRLFTYLYI